MFSNMIADMMVKPGKSPVFDNPKDFDLDYEDVTFTTEDGVKLSGWLIKGDLEKVIIQSHFGVQCSRSGFTVKGKGMMEKSLWNKDIHFLNQAKYLVDAGYSVLMYDFRNHGDSGKGTNPWVTWGPEEGKDVLAAVDYITKHPDYKNAEIGLFSICMGSSATAFAYALENSLASYKNIKAMVAVQPLTYREFVKAMGLPGFLLKGANKEIQKRTKIDFDNNTFMPHVNKITVPTLVIQNKNDPMTNLNLVDEFFDKLTVEKKMIQPELEKKRAAAYDWIGKNPKEILEWFNRHIGVEN